MHTEEELQYSRLKIRFFIMSLWILFLLMFILTVNVNCIFDDAGNFRGILYVLKNNWFPILSLLLFVLSYAFTKLTEYEWKGATNPPYSVKSVKNENYEYLSFLTTCLIPLVCIDLENTRSIIVLFVLLYVIGKIFVRMDLYYGNPTLAVLGYQLCRVTIDGVKAPDGIILISKEPISSGQMVKWIKVDKYVWFAKVVGNDSK